MRTAIVAALASASVLALAACGGEDKEDGPRLSPAEDRAVKAAFDKVDADLRRVEELSVAYELPKSAPEGTVFRRVNVRLGRDVSRLARLLRGERRSAKVPSLRDRSVESVLAGTADRVEERSDRLARRLDRTLEELPP
jgi:hypothetical protein